MMNISNSRVRGYCCKLIRKPRLKALKVKFSKKHPGVKPKPRRFRVKLPTTYRAVLDTPLAECFRCERVSTYQNSCYLHWQEQATYGYFSPDARAAITEFNLALAS